MDNRHIALKESCTRIFLIDSEIIIKKIESHHWAYINQNHAFFFINEQKEMLKPNKKVSPNYFALNVTALITLLSV